MLTPRFVSLCPGAFPRLWFCISNVAGSSIYSDDFVVLGDFWACFTCCLHMNAGEQDFVTMREDVQSQSPGRWVTSHFVPFFVFVWARISKRYIGHDMMYICKYIYILNSDYVYVCMIQSSETNIATNIE